jgi:sugar/nucleoside kinase (ribokinase family)
VPSPSLLVDPLFYLLSPVGEDVLADTLMRYMKAKGVEVELRQEKKGLSAMSGFRALNGNHRLSVIPVL